MKLIPSFLCSNTCVGILGTLLVSCGFVLVCLWAWFFDILVASMLVLKPDSLTLDLWQKTPMPMSLDFYFFNWLNPEDITTPGIKPKLYQMGPYKFREEREKVNLTWNDHNGTVTYRLLRWWHFDEKGSKGRLSDRISTLNVVSASAAHTVSDWSYLMKKGFSLSLNALAPEVNVTKSVRELLFDGYQDPLVDMAQTMPFLADASPGYDKFGWFYKRNGSFTFDGIFNMATGEDGRNGELLNWNYQNKTRYFKGRCGEVRGSAAELYTGHRSRDWLEFFSSDLCRYVRLDYEIDSIVKGIDGFKYSAAESMLDNGSMVLENECFCGDFCVPSGVLNVSACRYGTPAFVSLPHFYGADPSYLTAIEGMEPRKSKHEMFITLEPKTGIPIDVAVRLQLNIRIKPVEGVSTFEEVPDVFFPILWFEQRVSIPDDLIWLMTLLLKAPIIVPVFSGILMASGIVMIAYVLSKTLKSCQRKEIQQQKGSELLLEKMKRPSDEYELQWSEKEKTNSA